MPDVSEKLFEAMTILIDKKLESTSFNIEIPDTWEDLITLLPTLQGNNLNVAVPYPNIQVPDMTGFYSLVYQNGGKIYNDRGTKTLIDSETGVSAFKTYTSLFNSYGLPTIYDFVSRFRSGEMPLGIANYGTYNTLVVSAPEIKTPVEESKELILKSFGYFSSNSRHKWSRETFAKIEAAAMD